MSIFGPGRLIRANAVVTIQQLRVTQSEGGTVRSWVNLTTGVPVLISQVSASEQPDSGTYAESLSGLISGVNASLAREDTRLLVTTSPPGLSALDGKYLEVSNTAPHADGLGGLVKSRNTLRWNVLQFPLDD